MKLYFCRRKDDPTIYLGRLLVTREGYIPTKELDEVTFSGDYEAMTETACKYPELEVCWLDAEPTTVSTSTAVQKMQLQ